MKLLAPSILSANFTDISKEIRTVESAGADLLHLDVMDGHFVPNITFGPKMVRDINAGTDLPLDVHLMIFEPEKYIAEFAKAGADWISVHYETGKDLNELVSQIKSFGCKAGVVINPGTDASAIDSVLNDVDYVLVMSVNPGFGGQKFIPAALDKAKQLSLKLAAANPAAFLEMDGGIGLDNIGEVRDSGVNVFVCGNSIFASKDKAKTVKEIKRIINQ